MQSVDEETLLPVRPTAGMLVTGDTLADRYRVVRYIARGAMGEVYEVDDAVLEERVALKLVRREHATSTELVDRFRREVQLARKVTHPNVCRLHDVGSELRDGVPLVFVTMQLLDGETLAERIRRGAVPYDEALRFARDIAAALTAAHEAGVVHRDLKPGNVMIVGRRAVVTDFGLGGTPRYMAPEQAAGADVGPAADMFSFGVVLYEMITGQPIRDRPQLDGIHGRWQKVLARLLDNDPGKRFTSAREAIAALDPPKASKRGWLVIATIAAVLAAVSAFVLLRDDAPAALAPIEKGTSIAITDLSGDTDHAWIGGAIAELVPLEIDRERLAAVPSARVADARREIRTATLAPADLDALGAKLGAQLVVTGDVESAEGKVQLAMRVYDRAAQRLRATVEVDGSEADIVGLAHAAGAKLVAQILGETLGPPRPKVRASLPRSPGAGRLYVEGLVAHRRFDLITARERLTAAITIEPDFPLAHYQLSLVFRDLGLEQPSIDAAKQAWAHAAALPAEEKLLVEVNYRRALGERDRAREIFRALRQLRPTDLEYALGEARVSKHDDAMAILDELAKTSTDPRIDLGRAHRLKFRDVPEAVRVFDRAAAGARARGERHLLARILSDSQYSRFIIGGIEQARAKLLEARAIFEELGDVSELANTLTSESDLLASRGHLRAAIAANEKAIEIATKLKAEDIVAQAELNIAMAAVGLADPKRAQLGFDRALEIVRRIKPSSVQAIEGFRVHFMLFLGDLENAERFVRASPIGVNMLGLVLGEIERAQRDAAGARAAFEATLEIDKKAGDRVEASLLRTQLARLDREEGKYADCEATAKLAIEDAKAVALPNFEAKARTQLAMCLHAAGKTAEAEAELQTAVELGAGEESIAHAVELAIAIYRIRGKRDAIDAVLPRVREAAYVVHVRDIERALK